MTILASMYNARPLLGGATLHVLKRPAAARRCTHVVWDKQLRLREDKYNLTGLHTLQEPSTHRACIREGYAPEAIEDRSQPQENLASGVHLPLKLIDASNISTGKAFSRCDAT